METGSVVVEDVSKRFRLYRDKHRSIKERVLHPGRLDFHELWALSGVNFTVHPGSTVGILGHNGSGKSTLLKTICGVLQPTSGEVRVRGKLAGLLELGAGFEPELSGRDNIYLNGTMLGLKRHEIDAVFDEIVAFSELEQFIDTQVKFYSSGMYIRLGFAVAVNVDPEILVLDEVLAVGDERFQRKCMDRIKKFQADGRTIIFVSQSPEQVRAICDEVVVLHHGEMIFHGEPSEGIRLFRERLNETDGGPVGAAVDGSASTEVLATQSLRIAQVRAGAPGSGGAVATHGGAEVVISVETDSAVEDLIASIELVSPMGVTLARFSSHDLGQGFSIAPGATSIVFTIDAVPFLDGRHQINVGLSTPGEGGPFVWLEQAAVLEMTYSGKAEGLVDLAATVRLN